MLHSCTHMATVGVKGLTLQLILVHTLLTDQLKVLVSHCNLPVPDGKVRSDTARHQVATS